jgi:hypothetical protein
MSKAGQNAYSNHASRLLSRFGRRRLSDAIRKSLYRRQSGSARYTHVSRLYRSFSDLNRDRQTKADLRPR